MQNLQIRAAQASDLPQINQVVEAAFMTWKLPERVKRLSLASYLYQPIDLDHLSMIVAQSQAQLLGVAATEPAAPHDCPEHAHGLLLHGLYVHPEHSRRGIGSMLLKAVSAQAQQQGYAGVLVKAQADAESFFAAKNLQALPADASPSRYAKRYWLALTDG